MAAELTDDDYQQLLAFRTGLRRFLQWSARQAETAGLTANQHQLLLVVRGFDHPDGPTVGDVAEAMLLRHHSAVELVDRAAEANLVARHRDAQDQRAVRLSLTPDGEKRLAALTALNRAELNRLRPRLEPLWQDLLDSDPPDGG